MSSAATIHCFPCCFLSTLDPKMKEPCNILASHVALDLCRIAIPVHPLTSSTCLAVSPLVLYLGARVLWGVSGVFMARFGGFPWQVACSDPRGACSHFPPAPANDRLFFDFLLRVLYSGGSVAATCCFPCVVMSSRALL
eukprot:scaffold182589_cov35-Tisochrysis_lutea.AAC.1